MDTKFILHKNFLISCYVLFSLLSGFMLSGCDSAPDTTFQGYVEGDFVYVSAENPGKIADVVVHRGEHVTPGQLLAIMNGEQQLKQLAVEDGNLKAERAKLEDLKKGQRHEELMVVKAQIAQARSDASVALSKLKRYEKIKAQGYVSDFEFQQVKADSHRANEKVKELLSQLESYKLPSRPDQVQAQQARVNSSEEQLNKSQVELNKRLLFSAVAAEVYDVISHPGEVVSTGQPILSLLPRDAIKIRFFIPNNQLKQITLGQKINVYTDGISDPVSAEIHFISPKAEYTPPVIYSKEQRARMVFMIEAVPLDFTRGLKLGQPVEVSL